MKWEISPIRRSIARAATPPSIPRGSRRSAARRLFLPPQEGCRMDSSCNIRTRNRACHAGPENSRLPSSRAGFQKLVGDRVGQRLKRGVDDMGGDAGRRPALSGAVAKLDQDPRHRVGSAAENADAKIDEFE